MAEALKNRFDQEFIELLADRFSRADPAFDQASFSRTLDAGFPALELKDRINLVADTLRDLLDDDYQAALDVVVAVAEHDDVSGFAAWPLCSFVERHGIDHPTASLEAMDRLTRSFSCEFALRPFLEHHLDLTLDYCHRWTTSPSAAVRRLPSEGTRPRLPWGPRVEALDADPELGIALISRLRHDEDDAVRRSVANHLNDVARQHPDRVVQLAAQWSNEPPTDPGMIRHALRTLVKNGDPGALAVLGFTTDADIVVGTFTVSPTEVSLGQSIRLTASLTSTSSENQRLVVDFVIHHRRANGEATPKVFKWTTVDLDPGTTVTVEKKRTIATASTRRYHAGPHRIELLVAGRVQATTTVDVLESSDD